ncbi:MAG: hypothetical protein IKA54_01735 [Clostridia bacterium]|nr:hypothetical protein [Clostridia bacterium]
MAVIQPSFYIDPEIENGLLMGIYKRVGGVIRKVSDGTIVKHLKELPSNDNIEESAKSAISTFNWKGVAIGLGVVAVIASGAIIAYNTIKKKSSKQKQSDFINGFNEAMKNYLTVIQTGDLSIELLDDLIAHIDFIKTNADRKDIKIEISIEQFESLLKVVYDYSNKLAEANNISFDERQFNKHDVNSLSNIKTCLQFQRKVFSDLAA